jgi:cysteine dioxygenase
MLELIVLCWLPNQVSPVHNHGNTRLVLRKPNTSSLEDQNCWAGVLQGTIEETHFQFKNTKSSTGSGPLEVVGKFEHHTGQVGFIHDDIALHVLRPLNNEAGVTLHLYSKPIPQCSIYDPETGQITRRKMGFYTINKQIQQCS